MVAEPPTVWPTERPKVLRTMKVAPCTATGSIVVGSPKAVRRKPTVLAWSKPGIRAGPALVWRK